MALTHISDLSVQSTGEGWDADVKLKITNTGDRAGSCVAQVYVHECRPSVEKPDIELGGFVKAHLQPDESHIVSVKLDVGSLVVGPQRFGRHR